jgi:uncharacterized protein YndB with AHSA1/START domain
MNKNFVFNADKTAKKISMSREFNAPVAKVWRAFTEPALVEKWGGPEGWKSETKEADVRVGGVWKTLMTNDEGHRHWVYDEYTAVEKEVLLSSVGMFCDDDGNPVRDGGKSYQDIRFFAIEGGRTRIEVDLELDSLETFNWFAEGGFEQGSAHTYDMLDDVLASI